MKARMGQKLERRLQGRCHRALKRKLAGERTSCLMMSIAHLNAISACASPRRNTCVSVSASSPRPTDSNNSSPTSHSHLTSCIAPLPASIPHPLQEPIPLRQPVHAVVALAHRTHEAAQRIRLVLARVSAVVAYFADRDLDRGVVLGLDDAVGCAALARDVAGKERRVSAEYESNGRDSVWWVRWERGWRLQVDEVTAFVLHLDETGECVGWSGSWCGKA